MGSLLREMKEAFLDNSRAIGFCSASYLAFLLTIVL